MSKSQDYIANIRCQNDPSAPLFPPKLLNYNISNDEEISSSSLLSSLYRKENVNNLIEVDQDFGLSIDLIQVPGAFDPKQQDSKLYSLSTNNIELHPNDRTLLRDPGIDKIVRNQPNVSFLRRTEYIASKNKIKNNKEISKEFKKVDNTPISQLKAIESTFINSTKTLNDLSKLKHPSKKHLKPVKTWSFLPDLSKMDQSFTSIKFLGSASSSNKNLSNLEFQTSIFKPIELEQADWMSFYTLEDSEDLNTVKKRLNDTKENIPEKESSNKRFKYIKQNDYDMRAISFDEGIKDIALKFDHENNTVYYNPIQSKAELKRHRLNDSLKQLVEQVDYDILNIDIREPTINEINIRNNARHEHDPVNYEAIEMDDDEQDQEQVQEQEQEQDQQHEQEEGQPQEQEA